jgi:hypothetical protein
MSTENAVTIAGALTAFLILANTYLQFVSGISGRLVTRRRPKSDSASSRFSLRLVRLKMEPEPRNPWPSFKALSLIACSLCLVLLIYLVGRGVWYGVLHYHHYQTSFAVIAVLLLFALIAALEIRDVLKADRRARQGLKSAVAKSVHLVLEGDCDSILRQCQESLVEMGGVITLVNADSGLIVASIRGDKVAIQVKSQENRRYEVTVTSDSIIPSVRFDSGSNLKNVNGLAYRLLRLQ